jgi:Pyruvate phosphate dikinase, AMP/ATP-binding domain
MENKSDSAAQSIEPVFNRDFLNSETRYMTLGEGEVGGKAQGLIQIGDSLASRFTSQSTSAIHVSIPRFIVITTSFFDAFMKNNDLYDIALSDSSDERIAHHFKNAELPPFLVGDLRGFINTIHTPLAVRSSSLLEDAKFEPFAGIYGTKMIPNNQPDADTRFKRLVEAVKFVYASTFFTAAKNYFRATDHKLQNEKMAVIIQDVVGRKRGRRYYPGISGVMRSVNFYPASRAKPQDGVVDLALGLGKTIVEGGTVWTYSPKYPGIKPPVSAAGDLLKQTQTRFWAVNMGKPPAYDPMKESEYLVNLDLSEAEHDGTLDLIASTYDPQSDRITPGLTGTGPRIIDFASILEIGIIPLNNILKRLLKFCEEIVGTAVEIEFAMNLGQSFRDPVSFGLLQVRPMVVSSEEVTLSEEETAQSTVIIASNQVMGNGTKTGIRDIVCVRPETFDPKHSSLVAEEISTINTRLLNEKRGYLLIGFGRWGSSDPWLGIPVDWSQISGAKTIVEATQENVCVELSQGSHFFHNLSSFQVAYFTVSHLAHQTINWEWIQAQECVESLTFVDHRRVSSPLSIKVDGKEGKGVIYHEYQS